MDWDYDAGWEEFQEVTSPDPAQEQAVGVLREFFKAHPQEVFFSRQLEVMHEARFFHWITNRALRQLVEEGELISESRKLTTGGEIKLVWHRSFRYPKRAANQVVALVAEYSHPNIGGALGLQGEWMVMEGFVRNQFVMLGRETNEIDGTKWVESDHNLDFIFTRDGVRYGIEVKNTLGYMDYAEMQTKVRICQHLGVRPVFVVRMVPKSWLYEVATAGGFVLILKYQLYPWSHTELARRVAAAFKLPVDAPRALEQGTMERFLKYHRRNVI